uniref:Tetraspanin-7 n=1 Tax=Macaca fascicularis TaxID=9541 RepID=A0A7N9CLX1_MACFA
MRSHCPALLGFFSRSTARYTHAHGLAGALTRPLAARAPGPPRPGPPLPPSRAPARRLPPPPPPELCSMASRRMETKPVITCLKTLLIIYSFVFWITGVILLAVGVWGKLTLGTYISLIAENSTNAPYVLIGTGTTIVVFGLFGCFATCRGSPWMLKLYAMFLSLVFLAELVAGISGFVFRHEIKDTFLRTYTDAMQNYNGNDERSRAVDHVQRSLSCCGVQNYTNWSTSPYFLDHGIPPSCCMNETDCNPQDLHNLTVAATKVNQKGCYDLVTSFMETNMGIIAGVAFGIAFSQLIGMLLACCLSRFITANQYEMV